MSCGVVCAAHGMAESMRSVRDYRDYTLTEQNYDYVDYYEFQPSRVQAECELAREAWLLQGRGEGEEIACPPHWDRSVRYL